MSTPCAVFSGRSPFLDSVKFEVILVSYDEKNSSAVPNVEHGEVIVIAVTQ
jgi:hypothetical protein